MPMTDTCFIVGLITQLLLGTLSYRFGQLFFYRITLFEMLRNFCMHFDSEIGLDTFSKVAWFFWVVDKYLQHYVAWSQLKQVNVQSQYLLYVATLGTSKLKRVIIQGVSVCPQRDTISDASDRW